VTLLVACGLTREAKIIRRIGVIPIAGGGDAQRLEDLLEDAIATFGPFSGIVSSGIAGALDPALKPGDVVIGTLAAASFPDVGRNPVPDHLPKERSTPSRPPSQLDPGPRRAIVLGAELAHRLPEAHLGTVVGSDTIAATLQEKHSLYKATGALAVDMESHVAAQVATRHDLPFAILRTISDGADHVLPPAALVGMKPDGGMALGAVLASLARRPAQLSALIRTGRDTERAFRTLRRSWQTLDDMPLRAPETLV
jgi:adenosylhomocysteine nucleosidase